LDVLQILIAVVVTLWINWTHFTEWANANANELMLATEGMAQREHRSSLILAAMYFAQHRACN
jgi:hypothetical protein